MRLKLALRDVTKVYDGAPVLDNCTQGFSPGVTAIRGPGQSGKSTLLRLCALLDEPTSGKVSYFYTSKSAFPPGLKLMRKITLVLPYGTLFNTSAWDNVTSGLRIRRMKRREIRDAASEMLNKVGLYDKRKMNAFSLSRGECRRLILARAAAFNPDVLLLDEPTRGLDDESAAIVEKFILGIKKAPDPPVVIIATTDGAFAERMTDKVLFLKKGKIALPSKDSAFMKLEKEVDEDEGGTYINPKFF